MNTTIRGSLLPFLQTETWDFDPSRGYIHRFDFKGASDLQMQALQQDFVRGGIACKLTFHQGDTASLDVEDSTLSYTIDKWELVGNEESRDSLSHPSVLALADDDDVAALRQALENQESPSDVFGGIGGLADFVGTSIERRYSRILRGSTEYRHGQYVLRHTTNAPARWTVNIADAGVDMIYTPAQLLSEVSDGRLWVYPMPARLQYKISNLVPPMPQDFYLWGWLKSASTETTAANNRIDIVTEYTLEQWSVDDYPPY